MLCLLVFLFIPCINGLAIVSKTGFDDNLAAKDSEESEARSVEVVLYGSRRRANHTEDYIPVILRRSDSKIEAKIPIVVEKKQQHVKVRKGKPVSNKDNPVPVVRGSVDPTRQEELALESSVVEGLHPPSQTATDGWLVSQNLESSNRYPDSNGYYPNVGNGNYPPANTPKPTYGVPPNGQPGWGCSSGSGQWGGNQGGGSNNWGNGNGGNWGSGSGGNWGYPGNNNQGAGYPPNQQGGMYPPYNQGGGGGGAYPPNQQGSGYPQNNYPPSQGYPPNQSSNGNGYPNYPPSQGGWNSGSWQGTGNGGSRPWRTDQSSSGKNGEWVPCQPVELTDGRRRSGRSCMETLSRSTVRFQAPPVTPASKVDGKVLFKPLPLDVETVNP